MPGGRPPKAGGPKRYPELEELAAWFAQAMADAGYESPNAVVSAEIAQKNVVYGIHGASRFLKLEVVRALAVGLGRDPADVVPVWTRAKEAMDRAAAARRDEELPRLTSWAQLPLPTLAVRNLVEAQSKAVERLPYDMLGVEEPPLSALYVRQQIRAPVTAGDTSSESRGGAGTQPDMETARGEDTQTPDSLLPVPDALARHEHLLITGEPGAGKSTLSSHLAWTLARIWLREDSSLSAPVAEPVLPIRIAARTLVDQTGSWSGVLCQAARRSLGRSLVADPDPGLFAGRVQGARWLVMVDGLDEIADRDSRVGVIRTIAQHARTGSDYRFVVTSRPLPEAELAPLRGSLVGAYGMEPFGTAELRDFAGKWFAAQYTEKEQARAAADRFLKETEDGRLHELVQNPLLATIAAVNATVDPARPLPTSRLSLYQRFCERLLSRGLSPSRMRAELRGRYRDDPERRELHLWLDDNKREVLGALGRCRLEGEGSLREAALEWVRRHGGQRFAAPGLEAEVQEFLQATGLLVTEGDDYRFLHHSFAEFIAAESYALEITPGFPEVEQWIRRAFKGDERTLAMFVFCLWSERPECEADRIAHELLNGASGGHERPLLAGLLLAEGVRFSEANLTLVLDRLEAIGRNALWWNLREKAFDVLAGLGEQPGVLRRLERIAAAESLHPVLRLYAVRAFSRAGDPADAEALLCSMLGGCHGVLPDAAQVACSLGDSARDAVRRRAWQMVEELDIDSYELSHAAKTFECLGCAQETGEMARRVLEDPAATAIEVERAAEAWLKACPAEAVEGVTGLALCRPPSDQGGRMAAARALEKHGETRAAARIAGEVLGSGTSGGLMLPDAAGMWMKVRGAAGRPAVLAAVENSGADAGHYLFTAARLLKTVTDDSEATQIADWAQDVIGDHRWGCFGSGDAVAVWLAAEGAAASEAVMERTDRGRLLGMNDRAIAAEALFDAGAREEAAELARLALSSPNGTRYYYKQAAVLLVKIEGNETVDHLRGLWARSPGLAVNATWLQGVLDALPRHEEPELDTAVCSFARELVSLGTAKSDEVLRGLRAVVGIEGREAVPYLVAIAKARPKRLAWAHVCQLAQELAAYGERTAALDLWRHALSFPAPPQDRELELLMALQSAGATTEAAGWMRELIADPATYAPRRLRLRQMLAWLAAAEPALAETE